MTLFRNLAAAAALLAMAAAPAAAQEKVRIGTEGAYPPFNELTSDGQLVGFDIDIAKALCEEMQVECEFVTQDWDGIIPALLAGKYDAIVASMSITEERKQQVDFTDRYYTSPVAFMAAKDSDITEVTPEALAGKSVGAQSSTISGNHLQDAYGESDVRLYPTQDEANADLEAGRLDAVLVDKFVGQEWIDSAGAECCTFVGEDITDTAVVGEGIGIALRQDDDELREKINAAITAIRENGTYKEINDKYFDFDVYGE
ncbi:ABC transporter substrate-binding protein [Afifella pfennigii]|uniref:ABC transporter substrate-binding protein n=1 Tax=Afifella pfennigii TaxID=209897 RepID=UPI00047A12DD|nr:ABC transporter substrate-binding protein [Afifella pfennigii]